MSRKRTMPIRTAAPVALAAALLLAPALTGCPARNASLTPESPTYKEAVSAFFTGTVSLQTSDNPHAEEGLKKATELMPGEPAAWANWAVYQMRRNDLPAAAESLKKARDLAPDNAEIAILEGVLARLQGKFDEAMADFKRAAQADPKNLKA
jgi:Tfp pilus assembly protein PilF